MSDPLTTLRNAIISHVSIDHTNGWYSFNGYRFPEAIKTCFKRSLKSEGSDYYSLRDVIFFYENSELSSVEYRKRVLQARITAIVELDRKDLKDYLTGLIPTCSQIDILAAAAYEPLPMPVKPIQAAVIAEPSTSSTNQATEISIAPIEEEVNQSSVVQKSKRAISYEDAESSSSANEKQSSKYGNKRKSSSANAPADDLIDPAIIEENRRFLAQTSGPPAMTRESVMHVPGMDFSFALKLYNDHILKPQATQQSQDVAQKKPRTVETNIITPADNRLQAQGAIGTPIIIVPSALTSCITTINIADFLEKGIFIPVDDKMKAGCKREQELNIYRTLPDKRQIKFKVIDNPRLLRPQDWERVIAVFALGQTWQFKDWKWSNPVELFRNVLGVHLTMDDRAVDGSIIQSWNCKILKVFRFKRHMDAEAANEFWALLDDFIKLKRPALWNIMNNPGK